MDKSLSFAMSKSQIDIKSVTETELTTKEKVKYLWDQGMTASEIADLLDMTSRNIRKHLNSLGIDIKENKGRRTSKYRAKVKEALYMLRVNPFIEISALFQSMDGKERESARRALYREEEFIKIKKMKSTILRWYEDFEIKLAEERNKELDILKEKLEREIEYRKTIPEDDRKPIEASVMKRANLNTRLADLFIDLEWVKSNYNIRLYKDIIERINHDIYERVLAVKLKELALELREIALSYIKNESKTYKYIAS